MEPSAARQASTAGQVRPAAAMATGRHQQSGTPAASSRQHQPDRQAGSASSKQRLLLEPQQSNQVPAPGFADPAQGGGNAAGVQPGQTRTEMPQQGAWPGIFHRGCPPQYGQPSMGMGMGMGGFNGWGMPMMGGFANPYGMPFGMMGPTMDPMMAWYAMHYGQYAHAMQNQANADAANARRQAQAEEEGAAAAIAQEAKKVRAEADAQTKQNLRWWQDPEKASPCFWIFIIIVLSACSG